MWVLGDMSIFYRTQDRLTFGELTRAWAAGLGVPVAELQNRFLKDIIGARLDDAGPAWFTGLDGESKLVTGHGLRQLIVEHGDSIKARIAASRPPGPTIGFLTFDRARELPIEAGAAGVVRYLWHSSIVSKAVTLAFARLRELSAPTWWKMTTPSRR
jgi:hypothetical protein